MDAATSSKPRARRSGTTAQAILSAAVKLFAERGYHATSMREIGEAAGMHPAGIYHWYSNKEGILMHLQTEFLDRLDDVVMAAIAKQSKPEAKLAAAVREHVIFHGMHTSEAFVTDSEIRALSGENRKSVMDRRDRYEGLFIGLIEKGVESGVFRTTNPRIASYAILLECTGVALWFDPSGPLALDEVAEIHIELVLGSLAVKRTAIEAAQRATRPLPS